MPGWLDHLTARIAASHARRVFARFRRALESVEAAQQQALQRSLRLVSDSDFGRRHSLARVRTVDEFRRAVPLATYDDLSATLERVRAGETTALFRPRQRIEMFATSSGTTSQPKYIPVTPEFIADYRRGWNTFGLKMLSDHPRAFLRAILQSSGRHDESFTPAGIPCGAITGLLARTQKRIVRRYYVGKPEIGRLADPQARYYTLMRLGAMRDVAFAVTANPATLIRMAQVADEHSEQLVRDVHDGTLDISLVDDDGVRRALLRGLRAAPDAAHRLAELRRRHGALRPRDIWQLDFLACWTGGSMGNYLHRLREWWGDVPVRDVGLLASEGRVTIPLDDDTPAGVLDVTAGLFEFIPLERWEAGDSQTLTATQLDLNRDYVLVLTNTAGLLRYRLDDVVRVRGWDGQAPILEFLYRAGRVSSLAGEKLTENQVVEAIRRVREKLGMPEFDFLVVPQWDDPPFYSCRCGSPTAPLAAALDESLSEQNDEYRSRRKSLRLGVLRTESVAADYFGKLDLELVAARGGRAEQYKRPQLLLRAEPLPASAE